MDDLEKKDNVTLYNENPRDITIDFSFLDSNGKYAATFYQDGKNAHWNDNPTEIEINKMIIDKNSKVDFHLASGGGLAISLIPGE